MFKLREFLIFSLGKLIGCMFSIYIIITASFFIVVNAPGNPLLLDPPLHESVINNISNEMMLNDNIFNRYITYLYNLINLDLGKSLIHSDSIKKQISLALYHSLIIGVYSFIFAISLGIILGITSARYKFTYIDNIINLIGIIISSMPKIALYMLFFIFFSIYLNLFSIGGWGNGGIYNLFLPIVCLGIYSAIYYTRIIRITTINISKSDFIIMARAKGLTKAQSIIKHGWVQISIPIISILGMSLASKINGSLMIETVYTINGLGQYAYESVIQRDYYVILATIIIYSSSLIVINAITNIILFSLNPRSR